MLRDLFLWIDEAETGRAPCCKGSSQLDLSRLRVLANYLAWLFSFFLIFVYLAVAGLHCSTQASLEFAAGDQRLQHTGLVDLRQVGS